METPKELELIERVARAIADSKNDNGDGSRGDFHWVPTEQDRVAARAAIAAIKGRWW